MSVNPYAPPRSGTTAERPPPARPPSPWHARARGDALLVTANAALPDVCMKCGTARPHLVRRFHHFTVTPRWAASALVIPWLGVLLLAMKERHAALRVVVCPACDARWTAAIGARAATLFLTFGLLVVPVTLPFTSAAGAAGGAFVAVVAIGMGALVTVDRLVVRPRTLRAAAITQTANAPPELTLLGVHPNATLAICQRAEEARAAVDTAVTPA